MTSLTDLIEPLKREVNPPGDPAFKNATDDDYLGYLQDGFWEARLDGFLSGYTMTNGAVSPDLPDFYQYLIVLWAGVRLTRLRLGNIRVQQKSQAGPVSFEFQNSAMVLKETLSEINAKKQRLIDLSYHITNVSLVDGAIQRDFNDLSLNRADFQLGG